MEKKMPDILLVETDGNYLQSTFRLLFTLCVSVEVLPDSRQAWRFLFGRGQRLIPDLVILPLRLHDQDTSKLVEKMRVEKDTREIPVIVQVDSLDERDFFRQFNFPLSFPFVNPLTLANLVQAFPLLRPASTITKRFIPPPMVAEAG